MAEQSTIRYERTSPQVARITFANPPANLIVGGIGFISAEDLGQESGWACRMSNSATRTGGFIGVGRFGGEALGSGPQGAVHGVEPGSGVVIE